MDIVRKISLFFLDTLFPVTCLGCNMEESWICDSCFEKINLSEIQVCPFCEKLETPQGKICFDCHAKWRISSQLSPIDSLIFVTDYAKLSKIIHLFKYGFVAQLADPLGKLLVKIILKNNLPLPDIIIPVPLHKKRLRWRGFNQSELLAEYVSNNLTPGFSIPVRNDIVYRRKNTRPQMKIKNFSERKSNISGAFTIGLSALKDKNILNEATLTSIKDKTVLIIDDIATTGATIFEIGRLLRTSGAKKIYAAVLARQELK